MPDVIFPNAILERFGYVPKNYWQRWLPGENLNKKMSLLEFRKTFN